MQEVFCRNIDNQELSGTLKLLPLYEQPQVCIVD